MYIWQKRYGRTVGQTYTLSYTDGFRESLSPDFQIADVTLSLFFRKNGFKDELSSKDWIQIGLRSAWNADQEIPITIWFMGSMSSRIIFAS